MRIRPMILAALPIVLLSISAARAEDRPTPLILESPDDGQRVALMGNTRPEARGVNDLGRVDDSMVLDHIQLQLQRSPEREQAAKDFVDALYDSTSPLFHHWVTAEEFGERFGTATEDIDVVTTWLQSHGFTVNGAYAGRMSMDFTGTAGQVREAFQTEIHQIKVRGELHIANMSDPRIPSALAPVVAGIVSLHNFWPRSNLMKRTDYTESSGTQLVVPADMETIYNLNPLFTAGISGQGQTVALIEDSDVDNTADWGTFRAAFGLSSYTAGTFKQVHPASTANPCPDPGANGAAEEASLDVEWASASAPSASIELASCADSATTFGGLIAIQNLINGAAPPSVMSLSYGDCESDIGAAANLAFNSAYQQAAAEGVSVFVSSGDSGATACINGAPDGFIGINVNGWGSTPYNVSVGGTDFGDTYTGTNSKYWSSTNSSDWGSALSYIPEIPWNSSCASSLIASFNGYNTTYGSSGFCNSSAGANYITTAAGSGGPSGCATGTASESSQGYSVVSGTCLGYAKPSWQSVLGNPGDKVRDLPDVALFAASGVWGHYLVFCDSSAGACSGPPSGWPGAGGTSFASPIMAGIQALVNQKWGKQGNPNPTYYYLANQEFGLKGSASCNSNNGNTSGSTCVFHDVTAGDNDVDCVPPYDCYSPSGTYGVLSTSDTSDSKAYGATSGWDFATGLGSVNATNLVNNTKWGPSFSMSLSPASLSVAQGSTGTSVVSTVVTTAPAQSVAFSTSGLPTGATATFSPATVTAGAQSTMSIAAGTAAAGSYTVIVTGKGTDMTATSTLTLVVTAGGKFTVSSSVSSLSLAQNASGTIAISTATTSGASQSVALSATGLPTGATATFNPASVLSGSASTLTIQSGSAAAGTYAVVVTGKGTTTSASVTIELTVSAPGFSLAVSSPTESLLRNQIASETIETTVTSGFSETVTLSVTGVPAGASATFARSTISSGFDTTLSIDAGSAAFGNYTLTVKGVSGSVAHTATIALTVKP